jgi:hypothetical protein
MALVVVASAKGAPGVTTLTVALGALTPGAIVADLDPDGGDLALRYGRDDGAPLDPDLGLLSLAASLRRDHTDAVSPTGPVEEHLQVADGGLDVLLGVTGPDQAVGLGPLWSPLARALAETGRTVFADCGRLGPSSPAMPVLMQADAVLLLARAELEELAHLRERLRFLTATLPGRYAGPARIGVVLVAGERDRAAGPRTEQLLRASGLAVPVLGLIADDPRGAARVRGLHGGRAGRTTLVRSIRSLLPAVMALTGSTLTVGVLTEAAMTNTSLTKAPPTDNADTNPTGITVNAVPQTRADRLGRGRKRAGPPPTQAAAPDLEAAAAPWPQPSPEPVLGADPDSDIWLGTRAAAGPPVLNAPVPSPYRHAVPGSEEPPIAEEPTPRPSENGWPRPGRGTGKLNGATATVLQNWGR